MMADYKELFGSLVNKAKDVMDSSGVTEVYQKGASRTKAYGRIARLTLDTNSQADELRKVYTEIGRLYFEQARKDPQGVFAPLFAQAEKLLSEFKAKEAELEELKGGLRPEEQDIEVEITQDIEDFDQVVSATENEGKGGEG